MFKRFIRWIKWIVLDETPDAEYVIKYGKTAEKNLHKDCKKAGVSKYKLKRAIKDTDWTNPEATGFVLVDCRPCFVSYMKEKGYIVRTSSSKSWSMLFSIDRDGQYMKNFKEYLK